MKVSFWHSSKPYETNIAQAFIAGVNRLGDVGVLRSKFDTEMDGDVAVMIGVKNLKLWKTARAAGLRTVLVDKGYFRSLRHYRVSADHHQPAAYLAAAKHGADRWNALRQEVKPWRLRPGAVLIAGSSEKYHEWYWLDHPTQYAKDIIERLRGRDLIYRPKWSWDGKCRISGAAFDNQRIGLPNSLAKSAVVVTHGSGVCVDALVAGVPGIILGDGVTRSVSSTSLDDIDSPRVPDEQQRLQLLWNVAWSQFTLSEMTSGLAWRYLRGMLDESSILRQ